MLANREALDQVIRSTPLMQCIDGWYRVVD